MANLWELSAMNNTQMYDNPAHIAVTVLLK